MTGKTLRLGCPVFLVRQGKTRKLFNKAYQACWTSVRLRLPRALGAKATTCVHISTRGSKK